jgi:hypothetical protein
MQAKWGVSAWAVAARASALASASTVDPKRLPPVGPASAARLNPVASMRRT